jgi:hypothetical protein
MATQYDSQFLIPPRSEVPFDIRHAVIEDHISATQADVRRAGETARKIKSIVDEYRYHAVALLGDDKYQKFRAYVKEQKRAKAKLLLPPRGPEMSREEMERLGAERTEESQTVLRELGVNVDQLRTLREKTAAAMTELAPDRPVRDGKRVMVLLPSEVPSDVRTRKTNPWTIVGPPYGWAWWYDGPVDGFSFFPTLLLDAGVGLVGNISYLRDSDASDNDYAHMKYATAVNFWYQMPTPGLIEVWIEAVSRGSHHHLSLWDEWGWSNASVYQHDYVTLRASSGGSASELQLAEMSWFTVADQTDGYWDNHYLTDGATYWAHLVSDPHVLIPAGAWVLVEVGMLNFHSSLANDVEVYSTMDFSWIIKSVSVHSTGG